MLKLIRRIFLRKEIISKKGELHFRRWGIDAFIFGLYIHQIYKADEDKHLHDHPWDYISICLKGSFIEECEEIVNVVIPGSFSVRKATKFHKIKEMITPCVTTLFITGPRRRVWGYDVNGVWFDNKTYRKNKKTKNNSREGYWEEYHSNGNLWYKGHYENGSANGLWECYYDNGELKYKGNYSNGFRYGYWEFYYSNGNLKIQEICL